MHASVWSAVALMCAALPVRAEVQILGRVVSENGAPVAGARVTVRSGPDAAPAGRAITDPTGVFRMAAPSPGSYLVDVERKDYFPLLRQAILLNDGPNEIHLTLNSAREVIQAVSVSGTPPPIEPDRVSAVERATTTDILDVPYPGATALQNALRIMPSVVQDSHGTPHINGGADNQVLYTLDGFNVGDPLTGRFNTRLSIEAVQSVELQEGVVPAEYGKGSAGTMQVNTNSGDDKFRISATNFIPGPENRRGWTIANWEPRMNFSGPIRKGRAWFSDSAYIQYVENIIEELPKGQDRNTSWRFSNLLHGQVNLTPSNILFTSLLTNYWFAPNTGLGPLDPIPTTLNRRSRQWFASIKDQVYLHRGTLLEFGFASNRQLDRASPLGTEIYQVMPDGRQGNAFLNSTQKSTRDQWLASVFLPAFSWHGSHRLKAGADLDQLHFWQNTIRTGFQDFNALDILIRSVVFAGSGRLRRSIFETSAYLEDAWQVHPHVFAELGLRWDRDDLLQNNNVSPRLGIAWSPRGLGMTKISAGYAILYDATNLYLFTRPFDQSAVSTYFTPNGLPAGPPQMSVYEFGQSHYASPRSSSWNGAIEQRLPWGFFARASYLLREGEHGLTYFNSIVPGAVPGYEAMYNLMGFGRARYEAFEISLRQPLKKQFDWMASYTRSRATSNAVTDVSVDDPIVIPRGFDNSGPVPWDAPNRFLGWAYVPIGRNWAVASMFEYHSGFPFSIQDEAGHLLGVVDSNRYPNFFELNLALEKKFKFHHQRWAGRIGFNNVMNHHNFNVVNNVAGSPDYLQYYGGQSRAFNIRFRWLGKAQ